MSKLGAAPQGVYSDDGTKLLGVIGPDGSVLSLSGSYASASLAQADAAAGKILINTFVFIAGVANAYISIDGNTMFVPATSSPAKYSVIHDTDWAGDADDVGCLRVLCYGHKKGMVNLLGVVPNATVSNTASAIAAVILNDLGTAGVGIPVASGPATPVTTALNQYNTPILAAFPTYTKNVGTLNSLQLYQQLLANATLPVKIVSTGNLTNLYALLTAPGGPALIAAKVAGLYIMGGDSGGPNGLGGYNGGSGETNFGWLPSQTAYVIANWPSNVPIYQLDFTTSNFMSFSSYLLLAGPRDPVSLAYYYCQAGGTNGRPIYDVATGMCAIAPSLAGAGFSSVLVKETVNAGNGVTTMVNSSGGNVNLLLRINSIKSIQQLADLILAGPASGLQPPTLTNSVAETQYLATANTGNTAVANIYAANVIVPTILTEPTIGATIVDNINLFGWWVASDLAAAPWSLTNGSSIATWPDRCSRNDLIQTDAYKPTLATGVSGKTAVAFNGSDGLIASNATLPGTYTVYIKYYYASAPTGAGVLMGLRGDSGNQTINGSAAFVVGHKINADNTGIYSSINYGLLQSPPSAMPAVTSGAWQVVVSTLSQTQLQTFNGATGLTATNIPAPGYYNFTLCQLMIGTAGPISGGSFPFDITEIRIYNTIHNATQQAAVIAQLA